MSTTQQNAFCAADDGIEGAWIGIDIGTTNCACAVWDSTRGRPKLLQLQDIARPRKGKIGRIVPSVVSCQNNEKVPVGSSGHGLIGFPALMMLESGDEDALKASVTSVKRMLGISLTNADHKYIEILPYDILEEEDHSLFLSVVPIGSAESIKVTPLEILTSILYSIRLTSAQYLSKFIGKKNMKIPGSSNCISNCVIGVPAHFSKRQRDLVEQACRSAGFGGHVSTCTESSAACMAYGLFVSVPVEKHVLVLDMGGGTSDVTISKLLPGGGFAVVTTAGDNFLGGDDFDQALLVLILGKMNVDLSTLSKENIRKLLLSCRKCKEQLCGNEETKPVDSYEVKWNDVTISVTQDEFNNEITPLVERIRGLVKKAVHRSEVSIDEIILVGGSSRIPLVQRMLHKEFPSVPELCKSLKSEGAVAEGLAIQAAIKSGMIPLSEIKSALMLDTLPHPIGVLLPDRVTYVPILEQDSPLPATGSTSFTLSDVHQAGVTVVVVEDTGDDLECIGEFNFLLRRLNGCDLERLKGKRTVQIGLTLDTSGKLIVSIFDENDPEHIQKKKHISNNVGLQEDSVPSSLIFMCFFLFLLYLGVKLAFHDPELQ